MRRRDLTEFVDVRASRVEIILFQRSLDLLNQICHFARILRGLNGSWDSMGSCLALRPKQFESQEYDTYSSCAHADQQHRSLAARFFREQC
jgi:hypothetical protein